MDPTSSFITAFSFNKTISLSPPIINTSKPYVNLYPVKFSSITNYCYSYSNTLLLKRSNFIFPSSEQIASDNIYFLVQASPQISSDNLPLLVIENMLNKHYKQSLIFHINLLFFAFPNCKYTTFESIICSCITHFDLDKYVFAICYFFALILNLLDCTFIIICTFYISYVHVNVTKEFNTNI